MRAHNVMWLFAKEFGNLYAKDYADKRQGVSEQAIMRMDSKWLRGKGGVRVRKAWLTLSEEERNTRMQQLPDSSFPPGTNGILDERFNQDQRDRSVRQRRDSRVVSPQPLRAWPLVDGPNQRGLQGRIARLVRARSAYHKTVAAEQLLRVDTAYNNGDMTSLLHAVVAAVQHTLLLARSEGRASTAEEAYAAAAARLTDVFAVAIGVNKFDPDPADEIERPSAEFAEAKISKVEEQYRSAVQDAYQQCANDNRDEDPDAPLLEPDHAYFGKPSGLPPQTNFFAAV
ncbi:hypothetical protein PF005_g20413 [Phytophthora fragariae]|uniref:Uncharacterized protein n=2 Tax=Phytophthora fragariae TaxID=53985 RepID=A0A6A4CLZ6_9STRA|nr:hypothetical protein PF005_g20413 [Phytophthora fragariae]KAE9290723.1 hypothetical protein PF001_g19493 [Phytophthora fragariae]